MKKLDDFGVQPGAALGTPRRVRIWLDGLQLDYRADTPDMAGRFARAMTGIGARVDIDAEVRAELRPLPCSRLWAWPDAGEHARLPAAT